MLKIKKISIETNNKKLQLYSIENIQTPPLYLEQ